MFRLQNGRVRKLTEEHEKQDVRPKLSSVGDILLLVGLAVILLTVIFLDSGPPGAGDFFGLLVGLGFLITGAGAVVYVLTSFGRLFRKQKQKEEVGTDETRNLWRPLKLAVVLVVLIIASFLALYAGMDDDPNAAGPVLVFIFVGMPVCVIVLIWGLIATSRRAFRNDK